MNRTLKFRAWNPSKKKMGTRFDFCELMFDPGPIENHYDSFSRDTVFMQFTGLYDKNGREIYEGDILHQASGITHDYFSQGPVIFKMAEFMIQREDGSLGHICAEDSRVIGNIYESPAPTK